MMHTDSRKRQKFDSTADGGPVVHARTAVGAKDGKAQTANRTEHVPGTQKMHLDIQKRALLRELEENAQDLQRLLDKHATPKNAGFGKFIGSAATAKEIITYAHKLCYTTFAPPGYEAGVTVLHNFRPPMPQEWQLRASQLHASSGKPEKPLPQRAAEAPEAGEGKQGVLPKALQEGGGPLPDLPPMPPGWKPGDPIPGVKAGGSAGAEADKSAKPDKQRQSSEDRAELPMVELILNPEWEDAEEEFSDDDYDE